MHGGIDEFCQDPLHPNYRGAPSDQRPWLAGGDPAHRILRGGSWYDVGKHCCAPHTNSNWVERGSEDHGFRVVIELPENSG
jgi:formylglycine-generating enzyme required for sulfatase activity